MIDSPNNRHLKDLRKLRTAHGRAKSGTPRRFVAEGEDLVAAARGRGLDGARALRRRRQRARRDRGRARAAGGREQPGQRHAHPRRVRGALGRAGRAALRATCTASRDPGNVGTILRSALAFGAASVVLGPGTADPFGPKAVRASMGAIFAVPVARVAETDPQALLAALPGRSVALAARSGAPLDGPLEGEVTILVGAERDGLPADLIAAADETRHIPIAAESLNAAMAATVALYEISRVRPA